MAKHDVLNVSYMRKDSQFLADGTWYVTTPCPVHGNVDEEVSWDEAKTPHHAGLIADQRHVKCTQELDAKALPGIAAAEIAAAEDLLKSAEENLKAAKRRRAELRAALEDESAVDPEVARSERIISEIGGAEVKRRQGPSLVERQLHDADEWVRRYERGLEEAVKRVDDTRRHNAPLVTP